MVSETSKLACAIIVFLSIFMLFFIDANNFSNRVIVIVFPDGINCGIIYIFNQSYSVKYYF